jgi:hypothetical protein
MQTFSKSTVTGIKYAQWRDKTWQAAYNSFNAVKRPWS